MSYSHWIRIAHRGASGLAPENTLAAFSRALEIGVDAVELDVHASADGQAVVIHDDTLDRTTNLTGHVRDLPYERIRQADAGAWFGPQFAGERVPLLSEALDLIRGKAIAVVEIKDRSVVLPVVSAILHTNAIDDVVVISFHPLALLEVHSAQPRIPTGLLIGGLSESLSSRARAIECVHRTSEYAASTLDVHHKMVDAAFCYEVRRRGVNLWTWTVDEVERMRDLVAVGVGGITSNYPDRFAQVNS